MPSTYVILHYPTVYSAPVGIWYWNPIKASPDSYYAPDSEDYKASVIDLLGSARDEHHWDTFTQKLADRVPITSAFQSDVINVNPKDYLTALRKGQSTDNTK